MASPLREFFADQLGKLETGTRLTVRGLANDIGLLLGSPTAGDPTPGFQMKDLERLVPSGLAGIAGLLGSETGQRIFEGNVQRARDIAGLQREPSGFVENLAEFGPGAMIPLPSKIVSGFQTLKPAARIASELALPFNQIRSVPAVTAGAAAPAALLTGLQAFIGDERPGDRELALSGPVEVPNDPFDPAEARSITEEAREFAKDMSPGIAAAIGITALLTRRRVAGFRSDPTQFSGVAPPRQEITGLGAKIAEAVTDEHAPLLKAVERFHEQALPDFQARMRTTATGSGLAGRMTAALRAGDLPNTHIRIPSTEIHLATLRKLSPEERALYADGLRALDKIDDLNLSGNTMWDNVARTTLEQRALDARNNPRVAQLINEAHAMMRGLLDYAYDAGTLSRSEYDFLRRNRQNYVPQQRDYGQDSRNPLQKLFDDPPEIRVKERNDFFARRKELIGPEEGYPPYLLYDEYVQEAIRSIEHNRLRRDFIDIMSNTPVYGTTIKEVSDPSADAIKVLRNGVAHFYKIEDPAIRRGLMFNPRAIAGLGFNTTRRILQEFTTNRGNPLFVPISWAYEVAATSVIGQTRRQGVGILDETLARAGLPSISRMTRGVIGDPSVAVAPITGSARSAYDSMMFNMGKNMTVSLRTGGTLSRLLGPTAAARLARTGIRAYENSMTHLADQFGLGAAQFASSRVIPDVGIITKDIEPAFWAAMEGNSVPTQIAKRLWTAYTHALVQQHNAIRLQHLAANTTPDVRQVNSMLRNLPQNAPPQTVAAALASQREMRRRLTRAAADARAVAGDVGLTGGGSRVGVAGQKVTSSIPYANVAIQVAAEHARAARRNPLRYITALTGLTVSLGALQYSQFRGNAEAQDHYYNVLTPSQRAAAVYLYAPNSDKVIFTLPVEHLFRLTWSPTTEMLGTMTGMRKGVPASTVEEIMFREGLFNAFGAEFDDKDIESLKQGFFSAVSQVAVDPVPPLISAPLALGGIDIDLPGRLSSGRDLLSPLHAEGITSEQDSRVAGSVFSVETEKAIAEVIGTAALPLIQTIDAFNREFVETGDVGESLSKAGRVGLARQVDRTRVMPTLLGLNQRVQTSDTNALMLKAKMDGIEDIRRRFTFDVFNPGGTTRTPRPPLPSGITPEAVHNSALGLVLDMTQAAGPGLTVDTRETVTQLFKEMEDARRNRLIANNPGMLRAVENSLAKRIKTAREVGLDRLRVLEDDVNKELKRLGVEEPFRFDAFDDDMARRLAKVPRP